MSMSRIFGLMPSFEQINTIQSDQQMVWGWNSDGQMGLRYNRDRRQVYDTVDSNDAVVTSPQPYGDKSFNTAEIAMGLSHTLMLTAKGQVYSSGKGVYGRLGNGLEISVPSPQHLQCGGIRVVRIAAGSFHSAFITERWTLFTFGRGNNGQLGLGDLGNRLTPTPVPSPELEGKAERVACGADHTVVSLLNGCVYAMGSNASHQVSGELPTTEKLATPTFVPVNPLVLDHQARTTDITSIACGTGYTCIVKNGELYSWGLNDLGQCGIKNTKKKEKEKDKEVKEREFQYAELSESIDPDAINTDLIKTPTKMTLTLSKTRRSKPVFVQVVVGIAHGMALTSDGEVFGWGSNKEGQLGQMFSNMFEIDTTTPLRIGESLTTERVLQIAAGSYHSLALTSDGAIYGWGLNDYSQVGTGHASQSVEVPINIRIMSAKDGSPIRRIAAGGRSSVALRFYLTPIRVRESTYRSDISSIFSTNTCTDCEIILNNKEDIEKTISILSHKLFLSRSPRFHDQLDSSTTIVDVSDGPFSTISQLSTHLQSLYTDDDDFSLQNHLFLFVNNPLFSDVVICVESQSTPGVSVRYHAHKCVLVNRSPKLKHQLESNFQEGINNTIFIDKSNPDAYLSFLHYLYTDRLHITSDNAIDLLFLAHSENLDRMLELVQEYLINGIDDDNVSIFYEISCNLETKLLGDQCLYYIAKNISTVSKTESFINLPEYIKKKLTASSVAVPSDKKECEGNKSNCIIC